MALKGHLNIQGLLDIGVPHMNRENEAQHEPIDPGVIPNEVNCLLNQPQTLCQQEGNYFFQGEA